MNEEEGRELLRLQESPRRGQDALADGRSRSRQSQAGRWTMCSISPTPARGLGGQRLPLGPDRGGPESEGLAEPYPPARRAPPSAASQKSANTTRSKMRARAEHVFSHSRDGRQDRAHHRHRAGAVQDRDDEPWLQHRPAGPARADRSCARLSVPTGGDRVASCKRRHSRRPGIKRSPIGTHLGIRAANAPSASRKPILFEVPRSS